MKKNRNATDNNNYNNENFKRNKMMVATKTSKTYNKITSMIILIIASNPHSHYNLHKILRCTKKKLK